MSEQNDDVPWEGKCHDAAWAFGRQCVDLTKSNPYSDRVDPLGMMINSLMTELWDNGFTQTEIRTAFEEAIRDMPRYAAGEERRGSK